MRPTGESRASSEVRRGCCCTPRETVRRLFKVDPSPLLFSFCRNLILPLLCLQERRIPPESFCRGTPIHPHRRAVHFRGSGLERNFPRAIHSASDRATVRESIKMCALLLWILLVLWGCDALSIFIPKSSEREKGSRRSSHPRPTGETRARWLAGVETETERTL